MGGSEISIEISDFGFRDFNAEEVSQIVLTTTIENTVAVAYNMQGFTVTEKKGNENDAETKNNIFFFADSSYKVTFIKTADVHQQIRIVFYPNFKDGSDFGFVSANQNNYFDAKPFFQTQMQNVTLRNGKKYAIFSSTDGEREFLLTLTNGFSSFLVKIIDKDGTIDTITQMNELILVKKNVCFVAYLGVEDAEKCSFSYSLSSEKAQENGLNSANISSFESGSYASTDLMDISLSDNVALCVGDLSECEKVPEHFLVYQNYDAYSSLAGAHALLGKNDLTLYVVGSGTGNFLCSGLDQTNLLIYSDEPKAHKLNIDFADCYFLKLSIINTSIVKSPQTLFAPFLRINTLELSNVAMESSKSIDIEVETLYSDFFSLSNMNYVNVNRMMLLNGDLPNDGYSSTSITLKSSAVAYFPSSVQKVTFNSEQMIIGWIISIKISLYACVFNSTQSIEVIGTSLDTKAKNITIIDSAATIRGYYSKETCFYIGGKCELYIENSPSISYLSGTTFLMNKENIYTYNIGECVNCNLLVDSNDLITSLTIGNDKFKISNGAKSMTLSSSVHLQLTNNNSASNPLYIYPEKDLSVIKSVTISLNDYSLSILGYDWSKFAGTGVINFVAVGWVFTIKTEASIVPSFIKIRQVDGIEVDPNRIIIPYPTSTVVPYNYSPVIASIVVACVIVVIAIIVIIFFTPCGNWIGVKTYGKWGNNSNKYAYDDDQDAGIGEESSEANHFL